MKKVLFSAVLFVTLLAYSVPPKMPFTIEPLIPRKINVDWDASKQYVLTANNFEIVEGQNTPTVKLAAQEIADILTEAFGPGYQPGRHRCRKPRKSRLSGVCQKSGKPETH